MKKLEKSTLVELQLLTAFLERIPTESEMVQATSEHLLNRVRQVLEGQSTTLRQVLDKVLEDVQDVSDKRLAGLLRKRKWDKKAKNQTEERVTRTPSNEADKIREDKIREEERRVPPLPSQGFPKTGEPENQIPEGTVSPLSGVGQPLQVPPPTSPVEFLLKTWKAQNREADQAYPKWAGMIQAEISAALARGIPADKIEKRLWEIAGKGVKPWDLFPKEIEKEVQRGTDNWSADEERRRTAEILNG